VLSPFLREQPTLRDTVATLQRARTDARVKGVVITPVSSGAMWGQLQELRAAVADLLAGQPQSIVMDARVERVVRVPVASQFS